jgi:dipeptidyl aminopeptidase/acylaminoacyl peptidase
MEKSNEICVVNGDGSDRVCHALSDESISEGYSIDGFLDLSPDGTKVAYATHCNIYIWTIGGDVTSLRDRGGCGVFRELKWSPDGDFITYISEELHRTGGQAYFGDVFVDSLDGKVHRALTADLVGWNYDPDWSPDGRSIAFTHQRVMGDIGPNSYPLAMEIFVVSSDGKEAINFTNHSADDVNPHWSPDGSLIAFLSNRRGGLLDLYVMNSIGSEVRMVAELGMEYNRWPYSSYPITWLPDNRFILHNETLHDTLTGDSEVIRLPYDSVYASWLMTDEGVGSISTSHCAMEWSRLRPGIQAVVVGGPNDPPNRVRSAPSTSAEVIAQIYPGHGVRVLEGPVCADGLVYWKVESDAIPGGMGWTAEGDGKEYWLEP